MRIFEYIQQGGTIMYILLALNIVGFAIMISKFFVYSKENENSSSAAESMGNKIAAQLGGKDANTKMELARQELAGYVHVLEKGLNTVKIIASISPLLGLLGTVIGVLVAFRVMSETGLNNPATFAQGISLALITTVGGMSVAIPHFVGHNYLLGMLDKIESNLEKELFKKVL